MGMRFLPGVMKTDCGDGFSTLDTSSHLTVHFKWVDCIVWGLYLLNLFKEETNINSMPSSQGTYKQTVEEKNRYIHKTGIGDFKK